MDIAVIYVLCNLNILSLKLFLMVQVSNNHVKGIGLAKLVDMISYSKNCEKRMQEPGIEPGAQRWQRWILPLNHSRIVDIVMSRFKCVALVNIISPILFNALKVCY